MNWSRICSAPHELYLFSLSTGWTWFTWIRRTSRGDWLPWKRRPTWPTRRKGNSAELNAADEFSVMWPLVCGSCFYKCLIAAQFFILMIYLQFFIKLYSLRATWEEQEVKEWKDLGYDWLWWRLMNVFDCSIISSWHIVRIRHMKVTVRLSLCSPGSSRETRFSRTSRTTGMNP